MTFRNWILGTAAMLGAALIWTPTLSSAGLALEDLDGKLVFRSGAMDGNGTGYAEGSLTVPIGETFGFQTEAQLGSHRGNFRWGKGGYFFMGDPELGRLGPAVSHVRWGDRDSTRVGLRGETYFGPLTAKARSGFQFGDVADRPFGHLDLMWYPCDTGMLRMGGGLNGGKHVYGLDGEWQLPIPFPISFFAGYESGSKGYDRAEGGFRIYFGDKTPLKDTHRTGDGGWSSTFRQHDIPLRTSRKKQSYYSMSPP